MNARYDEIISSLRSSGYVADTEIATSLFLAEHLRKPILIEGEAGVGKTEIARVLGLAEVTIKLHLRNVFRKMAVKSRSEAAVKAVKAGLG